MLELIQPDWPAPGNVQVFTTTRKGGFSRGPWDSLNLGKHCGDNPDRVRQNRELLHGQLPGEPSWLNQVHGNNVICGDERYDRVTGADAIYTNQPGRVCAVLTADCLPVAFCNSAGTKVAMAHAGWRGLAEGVLEATVTAMNCDPARLMVWLGPAIGPEAFEVGDDVYGAFSDVNEENSTAFKPHGDKWLANLYELARLALARVAVKQVYGGQHCTFSEQDRFYSYRRDGETGRMVTAIWLDR